VLVVEDEPHIRELVCLHLSHEGYSCQEVGDGLHALKMAEPSASICSCSMS
jgi:DNA-binding response OmpR family regulator